MEILFYFLHELKQRSRSSDVDSDVTEGVLGNLRTTTKFTTTTSVDWEKTGTRTSVSAGKRKLEMSTTTTTLNVNTNVKL